jgi:hypothetical protein
VVAEPSASSDEEPDNSEGTRENQTPEEQTSEDVPPDQFLVEGEPLDEEETEGLKLIDLQNLLGNYREGNKDIRESLIPQLSTSGLLLTLSLGSLYFVLKDSSGLPIHPDGFIYVLFILVLLLTVSISTGIEAINKRVTHAAISTMQEIQYTLDVHHAKKLWSTISIWTLRGAFLVILLILVYFGWEISNMSPTDLITPDAVDDEPRVSLMLGPYNIPEIRELKNSVFENTSTTYQTLNVSRSLKYV